MLDLEVSGCPDASYNGVYKLDAASPTANDKPHFSNSEGMHLYCGAVNGWYFKDKFTPHESNATAYSMQVMKTNTWQWWNKERAEWISYACTIVDRIPEPTPAAVAAAPAALAAAAPVAAAVVVPAAVPAGAATGSALADA